MTRLWSRAPFMRLTIPFVLGILVGKAMGIPASLSSFSIFCFTCLFLFQHRTFSYHNRFSAGATVWLLMFSLGTWIPEITNPRIPKSHYTHAIEDIKLFVVKVKDVPKHDALKTKFTAQVLYQGDSTTLLQYSTGTLMLQIAKDSLTLKIKADDELLVYGKLTEPLKPDIPESFDYATYLEQKGIYHTFQVKSQHWRFFSSQPASTFRGYMYNLREKWVERLDAYHLSASTQGIIEALVWGKTDDVDKEQMKAYTRTGVVHILAVSGMHVGLIYALTRPITQRIRGKRSALIRFLIPAVILWLYAAITGFSPSVSRAAVMLTLVIITEQFQQTSERMNMFFTSMFLLVVAEPNVVFHVGFQLSYAAVLGIMVFQQPIKQLLQSPFSILRTVTDLCAVSIAAQLMTLPLCLYHFHQFPTYFLLANIIAVPISTAVLYIGLVFFAMNWFSPIAYLAINLCETLIHLMDKAIAIIDQFPFAVLERIPFSMMQCVLGYSLLYFLLKAPYTRLSQNFIRLQCLMLVSCISGLYSFSQENKTYFGTHRYKNYTYHAINTGSEHYFLLPDSLMQHKDEIKQRWSNFLTQRKTKYYHDIPLSANTNCISVNGDVLADYFHPEEKEIETTYNIVFPAHCSRKFYTIEEPNSYMLEHIYFDGKWSWKKKKLLEEKVRKAKIVHPQQNRLNIVTEKEQLWNRP